MTEFLDYNVVRLCWWFLIGVLWIGFAIMDGHDLGVGGLLLFVARKDEERRVLETEKSRVAPFGDFSMEDITDIERMGKRKIQFFCMKTSRRQKATYPDELIYIGTEYDLDYYPARTWQCRDSE